MHQHMSDPEQSEVRIWRGRREMRGPAGKPHSLVWLSLPQSHDDLLEAQTSVKTLIVCFGLSCRVLSPLP